MANFSNLYSKFNAAFHVQFRVLPVRNKLQLNPVISKSQLKGNGKEFKIAGFRNNWESVKFIIK